MIDANKARSLDYSMSFLHSVGVWARFFFAVGWRSAIICSIAYGVCILLVEACS